MLDVDNLHVQFHSLLFFSIPKLRHIHKRLVEGHIDNIVGEISFLFKNNVIVREKMKSTVKVHCNYFSYNTYTLYIQISCIVTRTMYIYMLCLSMHACES